MYKLWFLITLLYSISSFALISKVDWIQICEEGDVETIKTCHSIKRTVSRVRLCCGTNWGNVYDNLVDQTELNLSNKGITSTTPLNGLTNITKLNLSNNNISDTRYIFSMVNLEELDLSNNKISNITPLSYFVHLRKMNLDNNEIDELNHFSYLKRLEELSIAGNKIKSISFIKDLPEIRKLNLANNEIAIDRKFKQLNDIIWSFKLESLDLSGNWFARKFDSKLFMLARIELLVNNDIYYFGFNKEKPDLKIFIYEETLSKFYKRFIMNEYDVENPVDSYICMKEKISNYLFDIQKDLSKLYKALAIEIKMDYPRKWVNDNYKKNDKMYENNKDINECCICSEEYLLKHNIMRNKFCKHIFHSQCIESWMKRKEERVISCPICRE